MKRVFVTAALLLAGCGPASQDEIRTDDKAVATLEMCGTSTPLLASHQGAFSAQHTAKCPGGGLLRVTFSDGTEVTCPIGFGGAPSQDWSFTATKRGCQASADSPRMMMLRAQPASKPEAP